jgi:EAL domain-containing protein (putative c-di-GMP-specific phosphodiesterase class I)
MAIVRLRTADLREALASDGTSLQFQVQVHVPTATLAGVEALVRWPHPVYGMIGPQEIVQLVEQGGLHAEFDSWVLRAACAQAAAWRQEGVPLPLISVNVFEPTLRKADFLQTVSAAVEAAGTPPAMLELELPRGSALDASLVAVIGSVRTRGIRVAADARTPEDLPPIQVDTVKLPYRLTSELEDPAQAAKAREIVRSALERGLRVVAEGVETPAQQTAVLAVGCEVVQGYVFGPEVSAAEVSALARRPT